MLDKMIDVIKTMLLINPPSSMTEYACPQRCTQVINMSFESFKKIAESSRQRECKTDPKGVYKRVMVWAMKHAQAGNGEGVPGGVTFKYYRSYGKEFGRFFFESMMGIPREIRGFVCCSETTKRPLMTDLDMDNCHPTILLWLCREHNLTCAKIEDYVKNRPIRMKEEMDFSGKTKEDVKTMFLAVVNSKDSMEHTSSTQFFKDFDAECKSIQQVFLKLDVYKFILPFAHENAKKSSKRNRRRGGKKEKQSTVLLQM